MVIRLKFYAFLLFSLIPLASRVYGAVSEPLHVPIRETIRVSPTCSMLDVMKYELRTYENDPSLDSFEMTKGGLSAELVVMSPNYVARLSTSTAHVLEANQFDSFIRTAQIERANLENISFKLHLPISVLLVADETDESKTKTSSSLIVMPRAKGTTLFKHLASGMPIKEKAEMLFGLGKSLALFQRAFMDEIEGQYYTAAHGDFHEGNIFGAMKAGPYSHMNKWAFSLIDCAGLTLKGMHLLMDPLYFIYRANYILFNQTPQSDYLYSLTKSFYTGYLGYLPPEANKMLYGLLPDWRKIASTELTRTKGLLFFNSSLPNAYPYLSLFDTLNTEAARAVFRSLGYQQVVYPPQLKPGVIAMAPYHPRAGQYYPAGAVVGAKRVLCACAKCVSNPPLPANTPALKATVVQPALGTVVPVVPAPILVSTPIAAVQEAGTLKPNLTPFELGKEQQAIVISPAIGKPVLKKTEELRVERALILDKLSKREDVNPRSVPNATPTLLKPADRAQPAGAAKVTKDKYDRKARRHSLGGVLKGLC